MALKELYEATIGQNDFWKQVAGAIITAARDIQNESSGTEKHTERLAWAEKALENPKATARDMLPEVLKNATIKADVANAVDDDVQFVVNSLINTFAVEK